MTFAVLVLERLQGILVGAVVILQVLLLHVGFTYTSPHTKGIEQNKFSVVFWHDVTVFFLFAATLYNLLRVIAAAPVTSTAQQVLTAQVTHMTTSGLPTAQYTTDLHPRMSQGFLAMCQGTNLKPFNLRHLFRFYFYGCLYGIFVGASTLVIIYSQHGQKLTWGSAFMTIASPLALLWVDEISMFDHYVAIITRLSFAQVILCATGFIAQLLVLFRGGSTELPDKQNIRQRSLIYIHEVFGKHALFTWLLPAWPDVPLEREELTQNSKLI
eukprot:gene8220-817_t